MSNTSVSPFEFVKQINSGKKDIIRDNPHLENDYDPFLANQALSYFPDTVLFANEMNKYWKLPKKVQFSFLIEAPITKRFRYREWVKKEKPSEDVGLLMKHYKCNKQVATDYLSQMTRDQIMKLRSLFDEGGLRR